MFENSEISRENPSLSHFCVVLFHLTSLVQFFSTELLSKQIAPIYTSLYSMFQLFCTVRKKNTLYKTHAEHKQNDISVGHNNSENVGF